MFPLEPTIEKENHLLQNFFSEGDIEYLMSGRCGIYHCLLDIIKTDNKKVAYLPLYTCETVIAPFVKAGFQLRFYSLDKNMRPVFCDDMISQISVLSICGYYGFSNYDRKFVKKCHEKGVVIIEDMTHSLLSKDGLDCYCDYAAGSFRKWIGIACGGFALKKHGKFTDKPMTPHEEHLRLRYEAIEKDSNDLFWKGEMLLRQIFDDFGGDEKSKYIINHVDIESIRQKRRKNYQYLLDCVKADDYLRVVFPVLDKASVPSHFTVFVEDRDKVQKYLKNLGIKNSVFWPQGPYINLESQEDTKYIYDHVMSIACDQRYTKKDLNTIVEALNNYQK